MNDVTTVTIVDGGEDLLNDVGSVLLAEILLLGDLLEKFSSVAESVGQGRHHGKKS